MYENNFNRIEKKYVLDKEQYEKFLNLIKPHIKKNIFYESNICNIYFDNINNDLIIKSIEKPIYKQKIRLRSYEVPTYDTNVFFEIKTKYKSTVYKRRVKLKYKDYLKYINTSCFDKNNQIMNEIDYLIKYYDLKPYLFVGYDRKSYLGIDNSNLRITFDEKLRSRKNDLFLDKGDYGDLYFDNDMYIMEIKCLDFLPMWLVNALSICKIYPRSFSKIGNIYKKEKEINLC